MKKEPKNKERKEKKMVLIVLFSLLLVSDVFAATGRGGKPGALMSWGAGARSLGMGKAFVAVSDDTTATVWNPAGLSQLDKKEVSALHAILWADTNYDFISYSHPTADYGTFGVNAILLTSGGFEGRSEDNVIIDTFSATQMASGISYGTSIIPQLSLGANLKYFSNTLAKRTNGNIVLDTGFLARPFDNLKVGLNINNLLNFKTGEETDDKLPVLMRFGTAYQLLNRRLTVAADVDTNYGWYFGSEYKIRVNVFQDYPFQIAVRTGVNYEELTFGGGISYSDYAIDYAFSSHDLGASHRFSLNVQFGGSISEELAAREKAEEFVKIQESKKLYKEAIDEFNTGFYYKALDKTVKAIELDQNNADAIALNEKLKVIVKYIPQEIDEDKTGELTRKAIFYYVDGNNVDAVKMFEYILSMKEDERIVRIAKVVANESNIEFKVKKLKAGMGVVEQKLYESLGCFYEGKYDQVIEKCQEVLEYEPDNIVALMRLGSAYYAVGQKMKAKECWDKAYKLSPENEELKLFIERIESEILSSR